MAGFDISKAKSTQCSQEFRLQSSFDVPINFSVGANYTKFKTVNDSYVMFTLLSAIASIAPFNAGLGNYDVQNGRPSCRARVCQYVSITVSAVSYKQKQT